jgi:REP-associated tyrosine transposase
MPRPPRPTARGFYHLAARATLPDLFFRDTRDRLAFLDETVRALEAEDWALHGLCLMGTHYHFLAWAEQAALPDVMHRLHWRYACRFNRRHGRRGHLVGDKYMSIAIEDDAQLLTVYRYIVWNPVVAGLCSEPTAWIWSSYRAAVGLAPPLPFVDPAPVLGALGGTEALARERLRGFVEAPIGPPELVLWPEPAARVAA